MAIIHYSEGYGGNYNYQTFCGKEIHSHNEKEKATIHPREVNCKDCKKNKDFLTDYKDQLGKGDATIKRRIFIESDIVAASDIRSEQSTVYHLCKAAGAKHVRRVFSDILDYAWHHLDKTWEAVKLADEIYANSSLMPLIGGSYMGAPVIFNGMCERAIKERITGKDVYILNSLEDINWYMIDMDTMRTAFKKNNLFMYDKDHNMTKIDVSKIKDR